MFELNVGYVKSKFGAIHNVYCCNLDELNNVKSYYVNFIDGCTYLDEIDREKFDVFLIKFEKKFYWKKN